LARSRTGGTRGTGANLGFEAKLWQNKEAPRSNTRAGERLQVVLS
jgi:hypothetical protein